MSWQRKIHRLSEPLVGRQVGVGPAVPSVFLLVGQLSLEAGTDDWRQFWTHPTDPLSRISDNWSQVDDDVRFLCDDIVNRYDDDRIFWSDIAELGRMAYADLDRSHQEFVREANRRTTFVQRYHPAAQRTSIERVSDRMPVEFVLSIVGPGALDFDTLPVRLTGLEYDLREIPLQSES